MTRSEAWATAFFGVRGVGSLYYLAYATGHADFGDHEALWAAVAFAVTLSVVVHGVTATPAWWVNDALLIPGAQPREAIERWITKLQARAARESTAPDSPAEGAL